MHPSPAHDRREGPVTKARGAFAWAGAPSVLWLIFWASCACHGGPPVAAASPALGPLRSFSDAELHRIERVQPIVEAAATKHGVPAELINGVIWVESKFTTRARGRRGPRGLMQIMPRTGRAIARTLGRRYRPQDPDFNIHAGAHYLASMLARFDGDARWGLAAYNHGPGVARRWKKAGTPLPPQSLRYADRVERAGRAIAKRLADRTSSSKGSRRSPKSKRSPKS